MAKKHALPQKVVVVGTTPVAHGVAGLLLTKGVVPALVRPVAFEAYPVPKAANGGLERLTSPAWSRELLLYPTLREEVEVLSDADWIFEASGLPAAEKQVLFRHIDGHRKPDSLITSDESVSSIRRLTEGFGNRFCRDFAVTHFFLPVERLPLAEIVFHSLMNEGKRQLVMQICSGMLERHSLVCSDAPGFVANRIGIFFMAMGLVEAVKRGISVTAADGAAQTAIGTPRSGLFGLIDLIGVDVFARLVKSLRVQLPDTDELQRYGLEGTVVDLLLATRRTGRQVGMGFYKYDDLGKPVAALNFGTLEYECLPTVKDAVAASPFREILSAKVHVYMLEVCRSASISLYEAESAMQLGYGWKPVTTLLDKEK